MKTIIVMIIFYGWMGVAFSLNAKVNFCKDKTILTCPPTANLQEKKLTLVGAFYTGEQIPPTINCNYGLKPDGSYEVYLQYLCCMPNQGDWTPIKGQVKQYECLNSNTQACPFTLSTDSGC